MHWRLTAGGSADATPRWGRVLSEPFCHDLGGSAAPFGALRGGLDEVRVWNYARDPEAIAAEYRSGWELLAYTGATPPIPAARLCPYGLDTECPAYHVCVQEHSGHYCENDDDCDVEVGESCQPQEGGDNACVVNVCISQACASREDCVNGYCVEHPVLHERVCNVDCTFDAQCYDYVCASGGPCAVCDSGMCAECRTAADCPDSNAYYCDEGTCVSECYTQERGRSEFICPDFHSCRQGRCELFDIVTQDLLPATLKGATPQAEQLIAIEAGATFDYLIPPRMVVEVQTVDGSWHRTATFRVTKRARGVTSTTSTYDASDSVETFTTSTALAFMAVRIRMEPVPFREFNRGSRQTIGFLGDWPYGAGVPPNALGMTTGRRGLFVRQVRVGTLEFDSQSESADLSVKVCGDSSDPSVNSLEPRRVALFELMPLNCTAPDAGITITLPMPAQPDPLEVEHLFTLSPGAHLDPFSDPQPLTYQAVDVTNVRSF